MAKRKAQVGPESVLPPVTDTSKTLLAGPKSVLPPASAEPKKGQAGPASDLKRRLELIEPQEWFDRLKAQADRLGLSANAYIREAVMRNIEADEASVPARKEGRGGGA